MSHHHTADVAALLSTEYDLRAAVSPLPGESENYLLRREDGTRFVLKLADKGINSSVSDRDISRQRAIKRF